MAIITILLTIFGPAIGELVKWLLEQWLNNRKAPAPLRRQARAELVAVAKECVSIKRCRKTGRAEHVALCSEKEAVAKLKALKAKWEPHFKAALA